MDSEGEDADGRSTFSWVVTGRDSGSGEPVSKDSTVLMKDSKDSAGTPSDESLLCGEIVGVAAKGGASADLMSSTPSNLECVTQSGVTPKTSDCPVLNAVPGDDSQRSPSGQLSSTIEEKGVKENLERIPSVNVPEKIILCFDLSEDQFYLSTKFNEADDLSTLNVVKQGIEMFIHSKHMIDKRHEFALVIVHNKAVWLQDFTSKPKDIMAVLSELTETPPCDSFCLTSLFDVIKENVTLPVVDNASIVPPPYVIRPLIIYSRHQCVPKFSDGQDSFNALMASKYFGFDYIVIHESLSPESSDGIADVFSRMCTKSWSLKFQVSRSATKVFDSMAKLLSHPLQRNKICTAKELEESYLTGDSNGIQ